MSEIAVALITGGLGIVGLFVQNWLGRKQLRDEWQKRAIALDKRLQREHDERVAYLENELRRARGENAQGERNTHGQ